MGVIGAAEVDSGCGIPPAGKLNRLKSDAPALVGDDARRGQTSESPEFDGETYPVLQVTENAGVFVWLGIRD